MDTKEEWRDVVGFEGKYRVSSYGRVWGNRKKKYLTPWLSSSGYTCVTIGVGGKSYKRLVHRLVMEAFSEDFSEDLQVNHKDENKLNNMLSNLEMCTQQYNIEYSHARHYIVTTPCGKEIVVFNLKKFCRENNLHDSNMCSVVTGNLDHSKGYKARYKE